MHSATWSLIYIDLRKLKICCNVEIFRTLPIYANYYLLLRFTPSTMRKICQAMPQLGEGVKNDLFKLMATGYLTFHSTAVNFIQLT